MAPAERGPRARFRLGLRLVVGRLQRLHDRKREVQVYDYADLDVPVLARMFDRRCRGYEAVGYRIIVPASAVPGLTARME